MLAGVGGYDTDGSGRAGARTPRALGVQGLLSVTPYYNKPTQEGLYQHYRAIAAQTSLPIIVYNVPGRTGCNVEPRTLARLAEVSNIVGVKEASGNMQQMCEVCRIVPAGFTRAVRGRRAGAAAHGCRRPRRDLGGLERRARTYGAGW